MRETKLQEVLSDYFVNKNIYNRICVFKTEETNCLQKTSGFNRKDFYKIVLTLEGNGILFYDNKSINVENCSLSFLNPNTAYSWQPISQIQKGFFCLIPKQFASKTELSIFLSEKFSNHQIIYPNDFQKQLLSNLFENMLMENQDFTIEKQPVLLKYIPLIMDFFIQKETTSPYLNSSQRLAKQFISLLENQFPIDNPQKSIYLKTPNDFAEKLNTHPNNLNKICKKIFDKTTSEIISNRILEEAKSLLIYTNWNINEIAFSLGFNYTPNFNLFFKKQTNLNPKDFRSRN